MQEVKVLGDQHSTFPLGMGELDGVIGARESRGPCGGYIDTSTLQPVGDGLRDALVTVEPDFTRHQRSRASDAEDWAWTSSWPPRTLVPQR